MGALFVIIATLVLLWALFILPRQRQVRAHQQLVASLRVGDDVILSAGIYGRIVDLRADDVTLQVAPGVDLRVARQAVLRRIEPFDLSGGAGSDPGAADDPDEPSSPNEPG